MDKYKSNTKSIPQIKKVSDINIEDQLIKINERPVLRELLKVVQPIDFREVVYPEYEKSTKKTEDFPLKRKHYLVVVIDHIITLAKKQNLGLCRQYSYIYTFDGTHWSVIDKDDLMTFLGLTSEKLGIDIYDARHYGFRDSLYKQFLATASLPEPESKESLTLVNLDNGTFHISKENKGLREFNRNDFLKYKLPFKYDSSTRAPIFKAYLNKVLPDQCLQDVLAEYLGSVFIKNLKLEKALILFGTGANGKSVFFDISTALFGKQNVTNFSLSSLTNENGYYRAKLANSLVNYASEINGKLETSVFKQLVSGEPVEARLPYGPPFIMSNYGKLIFNCNELPTEVEHTNAYFRRFIIVPFNIQIPESEQDKELAKKIIRDELSGVFNWVLEGLERLLRQDGFTPCDSVDEQLREYKKQSDTVQLFIDELSFKASSKDYQTLKETYEAYRIFCTGDGYKCVNKKTFRKRMEQQGFTIERKSNGNVIYLEKVVIS